MDGGLPARWVLMYRSTWVVVVLIIFLIVVELFFSFYLVTYFASLPSKIVLNLHPPFCSNNIQTS